MPQPVTGATGKLPAPPPPPSMTPPMLRPPIPLPEEEDEDGAESQSIQDGLIEDQQYENESSVRPFDATQRAPGSGKSDAAEQELQQRELRGGGGAQQRRPESRATSRMSSVAASGRYRRQSTRGHPHRYSKRHRSADASRRDRKPAEDLKQRRRS